MRVMATRSTLILKPVTCIFSAGEIVAIIIIMICGDIMLQGTFGRTWFPMEVLCLSNDIVILPASIQRRVIYTCLEDIPVRSVFYCFIHSFVLVNCMFLAGPSFLNDLWKFNITANRWFQLTPVGDGPSGRAYFSGAFHPFSFDFYLFGGSIRIDFILPLSM
jgi:hypothetical protein